ncbi:GroES-like protein [Dacryopinax primogenitus]|uniref:GroES-like protein n=1 Tax=Dacryopinax primogenitus (strain DJM 731) TaxID=1858805 RepID=M5GFQ3_DACPD|nr:GroES-like protein [Dacryopinax primogenitus]EJU06507.1 GroES-like protein [Dacryopinax primogenitus]
MSPDLPSNMRALVQTAYGRPSKALTVQTLPLPPYAPTSDDLLIKVKRASIAPAEWGFLAGYHRPLGILSLPDRLGFDFSGVVVRAGEAAQAQGWKEGDDMFGALPLAKKGTYAEYITASSEYCAPKPVNMTWEEAACLSSNGMTALQGLERHEGAREVAFVTGGLGGVGHLAIQLLHEHFGFKKIITSVSTGKVEQIKTLYPYVEVIDYKTSTPAKVIPAKSVDLVFSTIGAPAQWTPLLATQRPTPTLIEITTVPGAPGMEASWGLTLPWYARCMVNTAAVLIRPRNPKGSKYVAQYTAYIHRDLEVLNKEAAEGRLKVMTGREFTIDQGAEAFDLTHKGVVGKVVFHISD